MRSRVLAVALAVGALVAGVVLPAGATHPVDPANPQNIFGLAIVEGPGDITSAFNGTSVYNQADPLWTSTQPLLAAAGQDFGSNPNGGVFFPGFGPPMTFGTSHFIASGINVPNPADPTSQLCVSTQGVCTTESIGVIGGYDAGGVTTGAYCGSSRGHADGTFSSDGAGVFPPQSYNFYVDWVQSGATILPLTGQITTGAGTGATVVGFVSARTTATSQGTCGRPSATAAPGGQLTFVVDGMSVSF